MRRLVGRTAPPPVLPTAGLPEPAPRCLRAGPEAGRGDATLSRRARVALAAVVLLAIFFWAAVSNRVYNGTLPYALFEHLFGEDSDGDWLPLVVVLRKLYSIAAFTLIGFVVHKALPSAHRPALRATLIVAAFSAFIEIAQKVNHAHEGLLSNVFDVACGAFGGWLAVTLARIFRRRA